MQLRDTIVAIATPPGHSGIGVVRLSGSESWAIALSKLQLSTGAVPAPRVATLAKLVDDDGHPIDHALATFFEAPNSYTAENVVEISCHGSPVVLQSCVRSMLAAGARAAEPGEFTLRAYVNGRLDLPRAEAVRDLINATTLHQARVAVQQVDGSVSKRIQPMKNELLELIALLEAGIDFAEDDISVATNEQILARLDPIEAAVDKLIRSFAYGRLVHSGFTLAILGRPNVGKSSLFNRLVGQERAIVTEIAGTTRDTVSETASLGGLPVRLVDTAGIRETDDLVESLGVQRSYQTLADADLVLIVVDLSEPLTQEDEALIRRASELGRYLIVGNKSDKAVGATAEDACRVSALTGEGIDALRERILQAIAPSGLSAEPGFITSLRHERLLHECSVALRACRDSLRASIPHEMLLLDLYSSLRALDEITGATTADDILNRIFSTFCIGK